MKVGYAYAFARESDLLEGLLNLVTPPREKERLMQSLACEVISWRAAKRPAEEPPTQNR